MNAKSVAGATPPYDRLLSLEKAGELGLDRDILTSCDWGGCNKEPWGLRWETETGQYLTVCKSCSRTA